jgi:hypothetical protein
MKESKSSTPATQGDLKSLGDALIAHVDRKHVELVRHFDVKAEQLLHDFGGIFRDRTEQHSEKLKDVVHRLGRVEANLGIM